FHGLQVACVRQYADQPKRLAALTQDKNIGAEISFADLKLNNLYKPHGQFEVPPEEQFFHIKISQGCLKECTFCVINKAKGYIRSIPREEVIKQYKTAIQRGYRKIFLMGEDTFAYGIDTGNTIVQLMEDLLEIEDKVQFDFGSVHIKWLKEYSEAILSWCERGLIKKLNVGLQHVNDKILKLMGRPVVFSEVYDVLKEVKKAAPDLYLGVDIIVGFPGETREIFEEIAAFFRNDTCLDNVSLSGYSDVKGAPSCGFENKNSEVEVTTRWSYLTDHVLGNRSAFNREDKTGDTDESFKVNYESDYLFCKGTFKDEITKIAGSAEAVSAESKVLEKDDGDFGF
ncbi:MAG: radical SAM protein, partial [bacterium]|nr:radical SAM protein [bacterium]